MKEEKEKKEEEKKKSMQVILKFGTNCSNLVHASIPSYEIGR